MSEFIFEGIAVLLVVNGLYSRFCEKPKGERWATSSLPQSSFYFLSWAVFTSASAKNFRRIEWKPSLSASSRCCCSPIYL